MSSPRAGLHVVSHDHDVREVLEDVEQYSSSGNFTIEPEDAQLPYTVITMADPPLHTRLRKRLLKNFAPLRLRTLRPEVDRIVDNAVKGLTGAGEVDLYDAYIQQIPAAVLFAFIGIPEHQWSTVQRLADVVTRTVPEPVEDLPEFQELMGILTDLVGQRRAHTDDRRADVLDNLCFAEDGTDDMADMEVVTHTFQLVVAATDTTRSLISNCVARLLSPRELWDAVVSDRSLLPMAIEESLRMDAPAQFMVRTATRAGTLHGCPIAARDKVYLSLQSANHDENTWGPTSGEFDFSRDGANQHLSFGRGIHACLGSTLARIEASAAIDALMDHFPDMALRGDVHWQGAEGAINRRPSELCVTLDTS